MARVSHQDFIDGTRHGLDIARHHARVCADTGEIDWSIAEAEVDGHTVEVDPPRDLELVLALIKRIGSKALRTLHDQLIENRKREVDHLLRDPHLHLDAHVRGEVRLGGLGEDGSLPIGHARASAGPDRK